MSEITPSQTVGPFFAYGLAPQRPLRLGPNGSYSWKETVGDNLMTPDATGDEDPHRGLRHRRRRHADQRRHDRDLAGRCAGPLRASARQPRASQHASSRASAVRRPTRTASTASTPSSRARCPGPTVRRRRRISCSAFFRAACSGRSTPASISRRGSERERSHPDAGASRAARDSRCPQGDAAATCRYTGSTFAFRAKTRRFSSTSDRTPPVCCLLAGICQHRQLPIQPTKKPLLWGIAHISSTPRVYLAQISLFSTITTYC